MFQRVCPHCTTLQHSGVGRCEWCDEREPGEGWQEVSATADPWLGVKLDDTLRVVQQVSSRHSLYRAQSPEEDQFLARFIGIDGRASTSDWTDEARRLAGLMRTRHLCRFVDALERDEYAVIVSEYVAGEQLHALLDRERTIDVSTSLTIAEQLAIAVESLHSGGFVHGRLEPGSIIISRGTHGIRATLCSFGNAVGVRAPLLEPGYLPPRGEGTESSDDVYAIGAILLEMLTGASPAAVRVEEDLLDMSPSLLRRPSELNPELAGLPGLDALVQDLTAPRHTRVDVADAIRRIGRLRTLVRNEERRETPARTGRSDDSHPGPSSTGEGEAVRTNPYIARRERTDTRRKSIVAYRGEEQRVQLRGSVLKLRNLVGGTRWGPAATAFDLRDHGIEGELEAVCAVGGVIWFGTSAGVLGRFDVDAEEVHDVATDVAGTSIVVVDACETWVAAGARSGAVLLVREASVTVLPGDAPVEYVSVSGRAGRLAVGRANGVAAVYAVDEGGEELLHTCEVGTLTQMDLSIDGRLLSISDGASVSIIDVDTGQNLGDFGQFDDLIVHPRDVIAHVTSGRKLDD